MHSRKHRLCKDPQAGKDACYAGVGATFVGNAIRALLLSLVATLLLTGCTGVPQGATPVRGFDAERYLGVWYEIVRLDHSFERGLSDVSATYTRRNDGGIDVLNKGYDPADTVWREAEGRAYFLGQPNIASLKVSFFGPFYGGYHVIALDPDYRWAMVAGPTHEYLWIMARSPDLPDDVLQSLLHRARQAGFNLDALIYVSHRRTPAAGL